MHAFSAMDCVRFAWETFKKRPLFLIGIFPVTVAIGVVAAAVFTIPLAILAAVFAGPGTGVFVTVLAILVYVLAIIWMLVALLMGYTALSLKVHDHLHAASYEDLWHPKPFWKFFGARFLWKLIVMAGLILLIVPGLYWALTFMFAQYFTIEKGLGPIEALQASARTTSGSRWELALLVVFACVMNVVGYHLLFVGLLVTIPVSVLAFVHAFRLLEGRAVA